MKKCTMCFKDKNEHDFYKGFKDCKKCIGDYLNKQSKENAFKDIKILLECANYIVNEELLNNIFFNNNDECFCWSNSIKLSEYLRRINALPQYEKYRYNTSKTSEELPENMHCSTIEKSDIDFINEDIRELKIKISNALQKDDINAHGKWMNSLRDAIELRDQLKGNKNYVVNINSVEVKDKIDAETFLNEINEMVKKQNIFN